MNVWMVLVAWILFAGFHIGLSAAPFRDKMGNGFQGLFSLTALVTFAFLIYSFVKTKAMGTLFIPVGSENQIIVGICNLLMILSFILLIGGFANRTPVGMGDNEIVAAGIVRITRHPMNMAFALFGLAHLLTNRYPGDWLFYGGFVIFGFLGALHQDQKKIKQRGEAMKTFINQTSIIPFVAILTRKQKFSFSELPKIAILIAIVVAVIARIFHPSVTI